MSKGAWRRPMAVQAQEFEARHTVALGKRNHCDDAYRYTGVRFPKCVPMCRECAKVWLERKYAKDER